MDTLLQVSSVRVQGEDLAVTLAAAFPLPGSHLLSHALSGKKPRSVFHHAHQRAPCQALRCLALLPAGLQVAVGGQGQIVS